MDLMQFLIQLPVMAVVVTTLSEMFSKITKANGTWARVQTWVISFGLVLVSDFITVLNINMFTEIDLISKIFYGVLIGLVATGIWSIDTIKSLLEKLGVRTFTPSKG